MLNKKGVAVVLAVGVMLIVSILVAAIFALKLSELKTYKSMLDLVKASYIADAGIENMIWYLRVYKTPVWEWGDPNYIPSTAQSGLNCWATRLNENYRNNIVSGQERLVTPEINVTSANPHLSFFHQFRGDGTDSRLVEQSNDGGITWTTIIAPATGNVTSWTQVSQALAVGAGSKIKIAFSLTSNANINAPGWYIDNICVSSGANCTGTIMFFDNCESGIGNWTQIIRPEPNSPLIFPPNPADWTPSNCQHLDSFDSTYATIDTWILRSTGKVGNYKSKSEAKVKITGSAEPYDINIEYWKRGITE